MNRFIKCVCDETLDLISVLKDEDGNIKPPEKNKRYRLQCSCGKGTYLSYTMLMALYTESEEKPKATRTETIIELIKESIENMKELPDKYADYIERTHTFLLSVKRNISARGRYTEKEWMSVKKTHRTILERLEE